MTHRVCNPPNSCSIAPFTVLEKHFHIFMLGGTQKYCIAALPKYRAYRLDCKKWPIFRNIGLFIVIIIQKKRLIFSVGQPQTFLQLHFHGWVHNGCRINKESMTVVQGDKVPNTLGKSRNTRGYYNICIFNTMLS